MSGTDILTTSEELRAGSGKKMLLKVRECQSLGSNVRQTLNDHIYVALETRSRDTQINWSWLIRIAVGKIGL